MKTVDMLVWNKLRMGMGYRTRRCCEYLVILQKYPYKAKWKKRNIRDVWDEKPLPKSRVHAKPVTLQQKLIEAVSDPGDTVIDPAAGSYSVLTACKNSKRRFLGCDICDF